VPNPELSRPEKTFAKDKVDPPKDAPVEEVKWHNEEQALPAMRVATIAEEATGVEESKEPPSRVPGYTEPLRAEEGRAGR